MRVLLPLVLLLAACNTAEPMAARTSNDSSADWRIEIASTGGFTGRGAGSVDITPQAVEGANLSATPCRGELTSTERAELQRLVDAARFEQWQDVPPPRHGADMIAYTLTLHRSGQWRKVTWTGEDVSDLPKDLGQLFTSAWRVRDRICG